MIEKFEEQLAKNGYTVSYDLLKGLKGISYQKRITDDIGTRYFINIWKFDFGNKYSVSAQMTEQDGKHKVNIEPVGWLKDASTLTVIEGRLREIWLNCDFGYYETTQCPNCGARLFLSPEKQAKAEPYESPKTTYDGSSRKGIERPSSEWDIGATERTIKFLNSFFIENDSILFIVLRDKVAVLLGFFLML